MEGLCFGARCEAEEHESLKDDDDETEEQHAEEHEPIKCHRRRTLQDASPHASIFVPPCQEAVGGFDQRVVNAVMSTEARMQCPSGMCRRVAVRNPHEPTVFAAKQHGCFGVAPCSDLSQ